MSLVVSTEHFRPRVDEAAKELAEVLSRDLKATITATDLKRALSAHFTRISTLAHIIHEGE